MSKIIKSLLIFTIISATLCNGNFLAQQEAPISLTAVKEIAMFSEGFLQGTNLFWNLTHQSECVNIHSGEEVYKRVLDIIDILKDINLHSDFEAIFRQLLEDGLVIYHTVEDAYSGCEAWTEEVQQTFAKVRAYLEDSGYIERAGQHAILNIGGFQERLQKGIELFKNGDYIGSGNSFGDLIHFGLFFDFKN